MALQHQDTSYQRCLCCWLPLLLTGICRLHWLVFLHQHNVKTSSSGDAGKCRCRDADAGLQVMAAGTLHLRCSLWDVGWLELPQGEPHLVLPIVGGVHGCLREAVGVAHRLRQEDFGRVAGVHQPASALTSRSTASLILLPCSRSAFAKNAQCRAAWSASEPRQEFERMLTTVWDALTLWRPETRAPAELTAPRCWPAAPTAATAAASAALCSRSGSTAGRAAAGHSAGAATRKKEL